MAGKKRLWDQKLDVRRNAQIRLPELAQAWIAEGSELARATLAPASMHRFRLRTKSLRYTLEFFRPYYGPGLNRRLAFLRQVQNLLGAINDVRSIRDLVASQLPKTAPQRIRVEALLAGRSKKKSKEFRTLWNRTFSRHEGERLWLQYLRRPRVR